MATFRIMVKTPRNDGLYYAYIRVTHNRQTLYMRTDKMVSQQHVDRNGNITDPYVLQYCSIQIMKYSDMLNRVAIADWNIHQVVAYIRQGTTGICFSDYARKYHDKMVIEGHARNARNYELAYQNLERARVEIVEKGLKQDYMRMT